MKFKFLVTVFFDVVSVVGLVTAFALFGFGLYIGIVWLKNILAQRRLMA